MRVSGPFLDRIDLHVPVQRITQGIMQTDVRSESSKTVRDRVSKARNKQLARQKVLNRSLSGKALTRYTSLDTESRKVLNDAADQLVLSLRAVHRVLRVARTIADLNDINHITTEHVVEALSYRQRRWCRMLTYAWNHGTSSGFISKQKAYRLRATTLFSAQDKNKFAAQRLGEGGKYDLGNENQVDDYEIANSWRVIWIAVIRLSKKFHWLSILFFYTFRLLWLDRYPEYTLPLGKYTYEEAPQSIL